jgi:CheY-like chemotaxis protein
MSIQCVVRVLVVDNDLQARSQVVKMLEGVGYRAKAAEGQGVKLKESAKKLALAFKPHVVIMDLRLSDEHADDRSGLELWKDPSFSSARCILYSAHLVQNYKITREAFQQKGVEDVIGKEDSPQSLVDAVERVARKGCGCKNELSVAWPAAWNEEAVIRYLYEDAENLPRDMVMDVFGRLFPDTKSLALKALEGTAQSSMAVPHGRAVLFQAWPDDKEPVVVKLAPQNRILREVEAYEKFIQDRLVGRFSELLQKYTVFWDLGGICYSFMGSSQNSMETFSAFYQRIKHAEEITKPLEHFFGEVWSRHYKDSRKPLAENLYRAYDPFLKLRQRMKDFPIQEKIIPFREFPGAFLNPVVWIPAHEADSYFPHANQAVIHGDLHGDNFFVDPDHAWTIDFERSGNSHILRDFVELEQNIITRLMALPESDLLLFYKVSVSLTKPVSPTEPIQIPKYLEKIEEIKKAVEVINELRSIAHRVTRYEDMHEYYWGLLLDTCFSLMLEKMHSHRWWRGLLFSSILCTRLKEWGRMWPPEGWPTIDDEQIGQIAREHPIGIEREPHGGESVGNMTNIHIGNITIGDGAKVGDIVLASEIQKSFNKAASADIQVELKEALKQLAEAVDKMNRTLPEEQAAEAAEYLEKLVDEATKSKPKKKWYSVSIEGLIEAAENLDKLGEPVINLSRKVLSLLIGGVID